MFSAKRKIRVSECGYDGKLGLVTLINYFQDSSEEFDDYYGCGMMKSRQYGYCSVMLSWDVVISGKAELNDIVEIRVYNNKYNGRFIVRGFEIATDKGDIITSATLNVGMCDVNTMKLTTVPHEIRYISPLDEQEILPRLSLSNNLENNIFKFSRKTYVSKIFADINKHVNNARYFYIIGEEMPNELLIKRFQFYYYKAVMANEEIIVEYCDKDDGRIIRLISAETKETKFIAYFHTA